MPLSKLFKPASSQHNQPAATTMIMQDTTSSRILSREFPPLPHTASSPSDLLDRVGHPQQQKQLMDYTQPYVHERMNDAISPPQLLVIPKRTSKTSASTGGDNGSFRERAQITDKERMMDNCGQTNEESDAATSQYSNNTIAWIEQLVHIYRQREADWVRREAIYRTREAWLCQRLREAEEELKWWTTRYHNDDQEVLCHLEEEDADGGDSNAHVSPDRALYDTLSENISDEGSVTPKGHPSSHCYGWSTTTAVDPIPSFHYPNHAYYYYGSPYQQSQDMMMLDYTSNAWHNKKWYSGWRNLAPHPTRRRRLQPITAARNLIL